MESSDQSGNWNVMKRYHLIRCWCIAWYLPILSMVGASTSDPLLLRVARGERTTETPVWMMRQAGRHMAAYRDLVDMYPTFRERSETPQVSLDISLQPLNAYGVDGCILFSDILTPLPAMGIDFSISEHGGITIEPIRCSKSRKRLNNVTLKDYRQSCNFVGSVLQSLCKKVQGGTILGFVGLPFTIGSYLIEGKTGVATAFAETKLLMRTNPSLVHDIFTCLATNIGEYACYQIESGAQVIQVFDSWAGHIEDEEYESFCLPYQQQVISTIQQRYPDTPVIIYMAPGPFSSQGRRLLKLVETGANVISVDHTVDIKMACQILPKHVVIQGNLDPQLLRDGPLDIIENETNRILKSVGDRPHIMNLGHGIQADTPESNAAFFVNTVHQFQRSVEKSSPLQ